eukprot:4455556-Alexandrium_andersonii.AAC.1
MSASLVGSEMCIRDRRRSVRPHRRGSSGPSSWALSRHCLPSVTGPGLPTVSYTHLTLPTICSV